MKKLIIAMLFLLFSAHNNHPMQRLAAKLAQSNLKSVAKKGFSGFMTGLHWTIAAGTLPIISFMGHRYDSFNYLPLISNDEATNFIRSEFEKHNTPIQKIILDAGSPNKCGVNSYNSTFIMGIKTYRQINEAILSHNTDEKMKWIGTLNHESNHLNNNDTLKQRLASFIAPFMVHYSLKTINKTMLPSSMKIDSFLAIQLIKIPSAFGKLMLSLGGIQAFSRYLEQQADDNVKNNIDALKGLKAFLAENIIQEKEYYAKGSPLFRLWKKYTASHPSTEKRIALLDQRIMKLEKASKETSQQEEVC